MKPDTNIPSFKCVLVGDSGVGKTALLQRLLGRQVPFNHQLTVGVDFGSRVFHDIPAIKKGDPMQSAALRIWDTAGEARFESIIQVYFREACMALVVYDVTQRSSFENVGYWVANIRRKADPQIVIMLVGTKRDLVSRRVVSSSEGHECAKLLEVSFCEVSSTFPSVTHNDVWRSPLAQLLHNRNNNPNIHHTQSNYQQHPTDQTSSCSSSSSTKQRLFDALHRIWYGCFACCL